LFALMLLLAGWSSGARIWVKSLAIALFGLASCIWWFIDQLSGNGIDYAVVYHLRAGMHGAGIGDLKGKLALFGAGALLVVALSLAPLITRRRSSRGVGLSLAFVATLLLGWATSPITRDLTRLYAHHARPVATSGVASEYRVPRDGNGHGKRNVVLLYLESVERSYLDQRVFPGLAPGLRQLSNQGLDFTDVASLEGSGWTIGGIVSSLCGAPLVLSDEGNEFGGVERFMPAAQCLSDHLSDRGYHLEFVGGAASEFAGKGSFLVQHGFGTMIDRQYFVDRAVPRERFSAWGVQDDVMLDTMAERFEALAAEDKPFMLAGLTLGTHPPDGSIAQACGDVRYTGAGNGEQMLNAVACTDRLVAKFVARLRANPAWKDTLVVIASDHLSMPNAIQPMLDKVSQRRNLLLMLGDGIRPHRVTHPGATIDTASLIADQIGMTPKVGFGRSLLRELVEPGMSASVLNGGEIAPYLEYAKSLWMLGSLAEGVKIDDGRLAFGDQSVRLPVVLATDARGKVKALGLSGIRSQPPKVDFAAGDQLVYADRCAAFSRVADATDWCVWYQGRDAGPVVVNESRVIQMTTLAQLAREGEPAPPRDQFSASYVVRRNFAPEQSDVGEFRDGRVYSSGREGALVYGPFVDLCPGSYQLAIRGVARPAPSAWTDFAAEGVGAFDRDVIHETGTESGALNEREIFLPAGIRRAEIRVFVRGADHVRLDSYTLLPIYRQVPIGKLLGFGNGADGDLLLGCGWDVLASDARGTRASHANLRLAVDPQWRNKPWRLALWTAAPDTASVGTEVRLRVAGQIIGQWTLSSKFEPVTLEVPAAAHLDPGTVDMTFDLQAPAGQQGGAALVLHQLKVLEPPRY